MNMKRYPLILMLLLALTSTSLIKAQDAHLKEKEALFNEIYGRAIRLDDGKQGSSEVLHHLWMAALIDDQQPVLLWDRAYYQAYLGNSDATIDDLKLAYKNSNYDRHIGNALMQMAAMYGEWDIAEKVSTRLLEERPDDAAQIGMLINIYEKSGKTEEALATLRKLKGSARTTAVIFKESQLLTELERTDEAEQLLLSQLEEHPNEPTSTFMLVSLYGNQGRKEEAKQLVSSLQASHPDDPYVRRFSIAFYSMSGMNDEVARSIKAEANRKGTEPAILVEMMNIAQEESKDPAGLIMALLPIQEELYKRYPNVDELAYKQASAHLILKDTLAAEEIMTKMIEKGTTETTPYHYFFEKHAMAEDTVAIRKLVNVGIKRIPKDGLTQLYSAILAIQGGDTIGFSKIVDKAIELVPKSDRYYSQIALFKAEREQELGHWDTAKQYYEESISMNPSTFALNNYAYALSNYGTEEDLKRAEEMARLAVQNSNNEPSHLDTYAWILYKRGSYSMAKLYMEKALAAMKEPEVVYYEHLAEILEAMKDYPGALKAWSKVIELEGDLEKAERKIKEITTLIQEESKE